MKFIIYIDGRIQLIPLRKTNMIINSTRDDYMV